jgi:hypothetical protein
LTQQSRHIVRRRTPQLKALSAWLALALMLCNVFYGASMGMRPMPAMAGGHVICSAHHVDGSEQKSPDPAQHGSDCCSCCLSMCCTGATLPDADGHAVQPPAEVASHIYGDRQSSRLRLAPNIGGGARAPPALA